jgi:hypothetical protein
MRRDYMTIPTWHIKEAVKRALDELPAEKIEEVLDFTLFLKARWAEKEASDVAAEAHPALLLRTLPASHLDQLTGLVAWGGDAVADTERLYDGHA